MGSSLNFRNLDILIHSDAKKIVLESDIILSNEEMQDYVEGIELDVDELIIDGNGHCIDACKKTRIFNINSDRITLKNIVFKNAFASEGGGAIKHNSGKLEIVDCKFIDNSSEDKGAGLYCSPRTEITISNTQFSNSRSRESGCIYNFNARLQIYGSRFQDNMAEINASVICNQRLGRLLIEDTSFKNNNCQNGGAVLNFGKCEMSNCLFKNNFTSDDGGAINNQSRGLLNISDTRFIENECGGDGSAIVNFSRATFNNVLFFKNSSENHAGSISNQTTGDLRISCSTFLQNSSKRDGGAIINWGKIDLDCIDFEDNSSIEWGGAILNNVGGIINVRSCDFIGNSCNYSGGAIFNGGKIHLADILFRNNCSDLGGAINSVKKAITEIYNSEFMENSSKTGAAIFNNSKNTKIRNCIFSNNDGDNVIYNFKSLTCANSIFRDNSSKNIVFNDEDGFISCKRCAFKNNNVANSIFYNIGIFSSLAECIFVNNNSRKELCQDICNESYLSIFALEFTSRKKSIVNKGILDVKKMDPSKIHNLNIINVLSNINRSENDFLALEKAINENDVVKLERDYCFEVYESDYYEGGIEIDRDNLEIDGCGYTIDGASRSRIFIISAKNVVLKNIVFKNGVFFNDFDRHLFGGGAVNVLKGASLKLENCSFIHNRSNSNGGAISNDGRIQSTNCKFINNKSNTHGGAIDNREILISENDEFKDNLSDMGGAIYNGKYLKIESGMHPESNKSQFAEAIYNAGLVEGSDSNDVIYDSAKITEKHEHESFSSLADRIEKSNIVVLDKDIIFDFEKDRHLKDGIMIEHDLTIDGGGNNIEYSLWDNENSHLFDFAGSSPLFVMKKGIKVILKNIIFKDCYSNGRNIINNWAELTIENCRFINNHLMGDDCLINNARILRIADSHFSNNMSSKKSLINNKHPFSDHCRLEMSNVSFINNNSQSGGSCISNYDEVLIRDSVFKANNTKGDAGCIMNMFESRLEITNAEFSGNDSEGDGGVIFNQGNLDICDSKFANNLAYGDGGAINNRTTGEMMIRNSEFLLNKSKFNGGVIFNYGKVDIGNSKFIGNMAKSRSGAIEHVRPLDLRRTTPLIVSNTEFKDNFALDNKDIYAYDGADVEINDCKFDDGDGWISKWNEDILNDN